MRFIYILSLLIFSTPLLSLDIKTEYITKDGIYFDIGKKDNIKIGDILVSTKDKTKKIKIISTSESHSIGCLLDKENICNYNIDKMLKVKKEIFNIKEKDKLILVDLAKKKDENIKVEKFIRDDGENFEIISQNDMELFQNNNRIFKLIIFNPSGDKKRETKKYQFYGGVSLYSLIGIELLEDYSFVNPILQVDLNYETDNHRVELLLDSNNYFELNYNKLSFNLYQFNYEYKYKNFKLKVGRDSIDSLNDFYIVDGLFLNWDNKNFKAGALAAFGVDYYDNMKTDFRHIYIGFYFGINNQLGKKIEYRGLISFIPELIYNKTLFFGALPLYINTGIYYDRLIDFTYQFKVTNTLLGENYQNGENKPLYFNHYLAFNVKPTKKIAIRLGFDSRDYLDLINKSYYNKTILEKIDNNVTQNVYSNFIYRFKRDTVLFSYKYRFKDKNIASSNLITLRYLMRFKYPIELSFRGTVLMLEEVNQFYLDLNASYIFRNDWRIGGNLLIMLENITLFDQNAIGLNPQLEIYKKFNSYLYLKSNFTFELRAKRLSAMIKVGYLFK